MELRSRVGERNPETDQQKSLLADYQRLQEENAALRRLLLENGIAIPVRPKNGLPPPAKPLVQDTGANEHSDKDAKIALFRGLFRGREDVYAVRMCFKSGEWGYVPASIRDWKAVLSADAALRKKVDQKTRKLLHAIAAATARKLESLILTGTMDRRHQLGMESYDRFFPNQSDSVQ